MSVEWRVFLPEVEDAEQSGSRQNGSVIRAKAMSRDDAAAETTLDELNVWTASWTPVGADQTSRVDVETERDITTGSFHVAEDHFSG